MRGQALRAARAKVATRAARLVLAVLAALVVATAVVVFLTGGEPASVTVPPDNVGVIDPSSNRVVSAVPVGRRPSAIAADPTSVWVANGQDRTLTRLDPETRAVEGVVPLDATPTGVAAGSSGVSVANGLSGRVARVDPQFETVATIEDVVSRSSGGAIAEGEGVVWLVSRDGEIACIDPRTGRIKRGIAGTAPPLSRSATAQSGSRTPATARSFDSIPVRCRGPAHLGRRGPGRNRVWGGIRVGRESGRRHRDSHRPRSYATKTITVGSGPTGIAVDAGAVWVANGADATASRIDPKTGDVTETIEIGNRPGQIAVSGGAVWVTVQAL